MNNAGTLHSLLLVSQNLTLASLWISEGCRPDTLVQTSCDRMHRPFLESLQHCWPIIVVKIYNNYQDLLIWAGVFVSWVFIGLKMVALTPVWWKQNDESPVRSWACQLYWLDLQLYKHFLGRTALSDGGSGVWVREAKLCLVFLLIVKKCYPII